MTSEETKKQIADLRKQMRAENVRVISCFNAGLTPQEYLYNSQLFTLKTTLERHK
jgi:hypothetical protein